MLFSPFTTPAARSYDSLGTNHPLSRAEERIAVLLRQSIAVALLLVSAAFMLLADGQRIYAFLVVVAAAAQGTLAVALALARLARREHALRLIMAGGCCPSLEAVEHERRRLLAPRQRRALASSLDELRREASRPLRPGTLGPPLYERRVIRAVDGELAQIAGLLRGVHASPRGVALARWLLSEPPSPLYGSDVARLRTELRRIAFVLAAADEAL